MKAIKVIFPKWRRIKVDICDFEIIFTEQDILNIADGKFRISKIGPCTYLIKEKEKELEKIFTNSFIKKIKRTGVRIEIKN